MGGGPSLLPPHLISSPAPYSSPTLPLIHSHWEHSRNFFVCRFDRDGAGASLRSRSRSGGASMSPHPPVEHAGEPPATPGAEGQRTLSTPFLTKTYQLVEDPAINDVISWSNDGSTFIVRRPVEFTRDFLPKYFKHNNFSSFVRQLNTYGFRKIVPDRWEFANDCFRRGEKRLLCDIHRRKISPADTPAAAGSATAAVTVEIPPTRSGSPTNSGDEPVLSSNSCPGGAPPHATAVSSSASNLTDENARLRQENAQLSHELSQMRSLCNNIFVLMTKYAANRHHGSSGSSGGVEPPTP